MKNYAINMLNFTAAACAFIAAVLWILSGGLGEVNLVIPKGSQADAVAKGAATFNTSAAWWALWSSVFVAISSVVSMMMKDDHVRKGEEEKREAEDNARLEKYIFDCQDKKSRAAKSKLPSEPLRNIDNSSLNYKDSNKRRINPYPILLIVLLSFIFSDAHNER